jgi:hypothetical protein
MSSACNSNVLQVGACGYELLGVVIHQLHYRLSIARQFCKRIVTRIGVRKVGKLTRKPVLLSQWTYSGYCMTCSLRAVRRLTLTAQRYAGVFFVRDSQGSLHARFIGRFMHEYAMTFSFHADASSGKARNRIRTG